MESRQIVLKSCVHEHGRTSFVRVVTVMPDHVHLVLTPLIDHSYQRVFPLFEIMQAIKSASAHLVNKLLDRKGRLWQEESFDHVVRASEQLDAKVRYILENPVRAGLVRRVEDYPAVWVAEEYQYLLRP